MITEQRLKDLGLNESDARDVMRDIEIERRFKVLAALAGLHPNLLQRVYEAEQENLANGRWDLKDRDVFRELMRAEYGAFIKP